MTAIWERHQHKSLDKITGLSRQRRWQLRQVANGKCEKCGRPRGTKGTAVRCGKCASAHRGSGKKAA